MKITKSTLKQLIKEELNENVGEYDQQADSWQVNIWSAIKDLTERVDALEQEGVE